MKTLADRIRNLSALWVGEPHEDVRDQVAALLDQRLAAPGGAMVWRDIESAPRDRTAVIVSNGSAVGEASFFPDEDGWWWANCYPTDATDGQVREPVIRWMPLPEASGPIAAPAPPAELAEAVKPRFAETSCSSCGRTFGPGDHGFSHCIDHDGPAAKSLTKLVEIAASIEKAGQWIIDQASFSQASFDSGLEPSTAQDHEMYECGAGLISTARALVSLAKRATG